MSLRVVLTVFCLLSFSNLFSQIVPPEKKKFNLGIYDGVGGVNFSPIPVLDVQALNTTLRLAPGNDYWALGIYQEILPLSKVFYNWRWIVSAGYGSRKEKDLYYRNVTSNGNSFFVLSGLKGYFGSRFYSQFQLGYMNTKYTNLKYPAKVESGLYFEFGLGINLFRNFEKKKD